MLPDFDDMTARFRLVRSTRPAVVKTLKSLPPAALCGHPEPTFGCQGCWRGMIAAALTGMDAMDGFQSLSMVLDGVKQRDPLILLDVVIKLQAELDKMGGA